MLRSLPGRSYHSLDLQIIPQTVRLQVLLCLLCLLVHCDGSDHFLDAKIEACKLKSLPGRSNYGPESVFERLNHVTNCKITYFTLKLTYPTIFYKLYLIDANQRFPKKYTYLKLIHFMQKSINLKVRFI